jgi:hypothetical protein
VREEKEHREGKIARGEKEYRELILSGSLDMDQGKKKLLALLARSPPRWIHASRPRSPARPPLHRSPVARAAGPRSHWSPADRTTALCPRRSERE